MTAESNAGRTALLVVDVQEDAVGPGLYAAETVLANIGLLVAECRGHGVEVVFVQHDGEVEGEYQPGTAGWQIHGSVRPEPGERVVRKKSNSAFRGTDLRSYLASRGVDALMIVGLHTPYCVDTTVRAAFEYGFHVIVPEMTNSAFGYGELTGEQIYRYHNYGLFCDRFAELLPMDEAAARIRRAVAGDGAERRVAGELAG